MSALAAAPPGRDAGSPEAYAERLYEHHHRAIFAFCLNRLRRREDADDAVQLTFMYALLSLRRGVLPELELPWLFTIARNVCSTRRRNGKRRGELESPQDLDAIQERLAAPERRDVARAEDFSAALRDIPENQRKAILLREWRGLSYEEIGSELGLSRGATEALLFRARKSVAGRLDDRAGIKTLQGLPFLSFLRNLFQSAAAKTAVVGAGAAMTIVAVPAGDSSAPPVTAPRTPVVHSVPAASVRADAGAAPFQRRTPARSRSSARGDVPARVDTRSATPPGHEGDATKAAAATVAPPAATATSSPGATGATPARKPEPPVPVVTDASAQVVNTVDNVVDTVTSTASGVDLPAPPLPVQPPATPSVKLP